MFFQTDGQRHSVRPSWPFLPLLNSRFLFAVSLHKCDARHSLDVNILCIWTVHLLHHLLSSACIQTPSKTRRWWRIDTNLEINLHKMARQAKQRSMYEWTFVVSSITLHLHDDWEIIKKINRQVLLNKLYYLLRCWYDSFQMAQEKQRPVQDHPLLICRHHLRPRLHPSSTEHQLLMTSTTIKS